MPFDQIYWNHYGAGNFANKGFFDVSESQDVRFGVTATSDSHSTFSFYGKRRGKVGSFWELLYRDPSFPFTAHSFGNANGNNGIGDGGFWDQANDPPQPTANSGNTKNACDESKGWTDSGFNGVCKPAREWHIGITESMVYSWPGIEDRCYTNFNVNDMKKTGNSGNNIEGVYDNPTDDQLFQSQNRESCHNISNTSRVKDAQNTFIGIHKDYPLTVTTTQSMRGYYLILKRKRFTYNEYKSKHTKQYGGNSSSPHWQKGGNIKLSNTDSRQGNFLRLNVAVDTDRENPWIDKPYDSTEEMATDNITGILCSPLGAPLSTTRDYEEIYNWGGGYNWRAAGESGLSGRTVEDDLLGLFRDYVPWAGIFPIPLDDQDKELNGWIYDWTVYIVNIALWKTYKPNAASETAAAKSAYDTAQANTDAQWKTYQDLQNDAVAKKAEYDRLKAIADAAYEAANDAQTALNNANTAESNAWDAYIGRFNSYTPVTDDTFQLSTYFGWSSTYLGTTLYNEKKAEDEYAEWYNYCAQWANYEDPSSGYVWTVNDSIGYLCPDGSDNSNALWAAYDNMVWWQNFADDELTAVNQLSAAHTAAEAVVTAAVATQVAAAAASDAANEDSNAAADASDAAQLLPAPAYTEWQRLDGISADLYEDYIIAQTYETRVDDQIAAWETEESKYPNNATSSMRDRIKNPTFYTPTRLNWRLPQFTNDTGEIDTELDVIAPNGEDHDGSVRVMDAVIHPTFVPRERAETGSVYIKSITIKKNNQVLRAAQDSIGTYIQVPSQEIYTDRSSTIKASGSKDQKWVTFTNLYNNRTDIIHRYISDTFYIKFPSGDWYEIASVQSSGNKIQLTENLKETLSSSNFILYIPRGSPNVNYTWGHYDLTEFDKDTYAELVDKSKRHMWWKDGNLEEIPDSLMDPMGVYNFTDDEKATLMHVINDSTAVLVRDLFTNTSVDPNRDTLDTLYASPTMGLEMGHTGKATRHPYFSNELSESLHIRNDFFTWAYYEYLYFGAPAGQSGHISAKVKGNVSWDKYSWVQYWEWKGTNWKLETEALGKYATSGFSNLNQSEFDGFTHKYTDLYGVDIPTKAKQFWYGGIDKSSSALWPCYENNIAALCSENEHNPFHQSFTTHYGSWVDEFAEGYTNWNHSIRGVNLGADANNTPSVQRVLDRPWFSYCAFNRVPGLQINYRSSLNYSNQRMLMAFAMTHRNLNETDNADRAKPIHALMDAKYEKILKRPSVLAQYGYVGDLFGYSNEDVGFANNDWIDHNMTIYESNESISAGTKFEVSLHQAGTEFNDDPRTEFEKRAVDDNQVGDGRSKIALDNYTLYVVAK